jgi:radical SAM protein with 4Fe4S-binding SPASM domain
MSFEGFPFIVGWELTLACNLSCRHCASSAGHRRRDELTTAEALALCDQFRDLMVQEVDFTGGEPLMRRDWPTIVSRVAALGIRSKLVTNGTLVTPEKARELKDAGLHAVGVSIDGLAATHDRIRGADGLLAETLEGVEHLLAADLPVTAITTVNGLNLPELPAIFKMLVARGIPRWQVQPIFTLGRSREAPDLFLSPEQFLALGDAVAALAPVAEACGIELLPGDSFGYCSEYDLFDLPWRGCGAGIVSCGITSDGKVKGCLSLPDRFVEGNLREHDLWDIWFAAESFAFTRGFRVAQLGAACRGCQWGEQCQGGCSAMAYASTGEFHHNPYCFHGLSTKTRVGRGEERAPTFGVA